MSRYFDKFPKLLYNKNGQTTLVTNILTRISVIQGTFDSSAIFYMYDVQEGDSPEIVASKYYGDPELHWIVMLFNDIYDPFYDWPMSYQQFLKFIEEKYGNVSTAQATNHHYEKIIQSTDSYTGNITKKVYQIDLPSYNSVIPSSTTKSFNNGTSVTVEVSKRNVDCYTFENELNDSKRTIRLIKKELIPDVKRQFEYLMGV